MESLPDDEKKFDADNAGRNDDDDQMPDPDEPLMLDQGNGRVWMVKVCSSCHSADIGYGTHLRVL